MSQYRLIEESPEDAARENEKWLREMQDARQRQEADHAAGIPAVRRLFEIANGNSGQCRKVAAFLLGLYNGSRFPFDLTDMRAVDQAIFEDMLLVLRMDSRLMQEVHTYFPNGGPTFERLAQDWNLYKQEWTPVGKAGFERRRGAYRLFIEAVLREDTVAWTWRVYRYDDDLDVATGVAWTTDGAKRSIDEWFDKGGETPYPDED